MRKMRRLLPNAPRDIKKAGKGSVFIPSPVLGTPYGLLIPLTASRSSLLLIPPTRAESSLWFIHTPHRFAELPYLRGAVCHPVCPQAESLPVGNHSAGANKPQGLLP